MTGELQERHFTDAQCDALFAAVLVNDVVDAHTELPDVIELNLTEQQLSDCFGICRQLWKSGVQRETLLALTGKLWRDRDLDAEDRLAFKHARAKFKHLRFAYALYDASHRYPLMLDWMTTAMGHLQDAFKNQRHGTVAREAALSRLLLTAGPQRLLTSELDRFTPCSSEAFRLYVRKQAANLREVLARDAVTGEQFHATRKIISRQVSFYDSLRSIEPSRQAFLMSRSLAAINGLMGDMHDKLVEQSMAGTRDYRREPLALPEDIRRRLSELSERYLAI